MEQISPNTPDQAGSVGEDYRKLWDTVDECGADLSDLLNNDETFAAIRYGEKDILSPMRISCARTEPWWSLSWASAFRRRSTG